MDDIDEFCQPTIDCLSKAWTAAIECEEIPGARSESIGNLVRLRNLKTTWFGENECKFRSAVDYYLESLGIEV